MIAGKKILIGVSGGIAIYKVLDLISRLKKAGAQVKVVMTEAATEFVAPITFQTMSENVVHVEMFNQLMNMDVEHISLAKWADLILIAPATANTIAKIRHGIADNLLTTVLSARVSPVAIAPAMNTKMLQNPATQENINALKTWPGFHFLEPTSGLLACQDVGDGKMMEPVDMLDHLDAILTEKTLAGRTVTVTAGPTQEALDPVRYLTNHSSGKMGYALAKIARNRGAKVHLITGPTDLDYPWGILVHPVTSTQEMFDAVASVHKETDILIKAAAPSDFRPANFSDKKVKKRETKEMVLELATNPDIAKHFGQLKGERIHVGFAAESHELETYAQGKLEEKNLDFIVANNITQEHAGFRSDTNIVKIFYRGGEVVSLPMMTKSELAMEILDRVQALRS